ncbi:alpha/beta fold hydrolase [soil metagenome]
MMLMVRVLAVSVAVLVAGLAAPTAAQESPQDPPLTGPADQLEASLTCPAVFSHPEREPVLLVHGTFTNDDENWGWNYGLVLPREGFDVCTVRLPNRSLDDIQIASEYAVHAIEVIHAATGRKVDVIGHSQGGIEPRWAVRWWSSARAAVDDLVMLAAPNHGTGAGGDGRSACFDACHQMRAGSAFLAALNTDETPGDIAYTSVYSSFYDELVTPAESSALVDDGPRVTNVEIQARRRPPH